MAEQRKRKRKAHPNQRRGNIPTIVRWEQDGVLKEKLQKLYEMSASSTNQEVIADAIGIDATTLRAMINPKDSRYDMRVSHAYYGGKHARALTADSFLTDVITDEAVPIETRIRVAEGVLKEHRPYLEGGLTTTSQMKRKITMLEKSLAEYKQLLDAKDAMIAELRSQLDYYYSTEDEEPDSSGGVGGDVPVSFAVTVPEEDGEGYGCKDETEEVRTDTEK